MSWYATKKNYDGLPAEPDEILDAEDWNDMVTDQLDHAERHQTGGTDEISSVPEAHKFVTKRTITLTGDVNGSVEFDGSENVEISCEVKQVDGGNA